MTTWNLESMKSHLLICNGSSCLKKGGEEVTLAVRDEIARLGIDEQIHTTRTRCNGRCKDACVVIAYPQGTWYKAESPEIGRQIVRDCMDQQVAPHVVYQTIKGNMTKNPTSGAIKGISKNK
ncbi:(2Fe-2S) ferredoxin domain-containing protein [Viridibacillus arvi]|uniref:(2Fe-2S) ferredoxin domain-containing protein n=1 Tax=Viridibacillus arvi TaxID=263475 RepID=UPI0036C655BA